MNFFLDFFWPPAICIHFTHLATGTPVLGQSTQRTLHLPKPALGVVGTLKKNLILKNQFPSKVFGTYRQVNPRHVNLPRGQECMQAAMAPPEPLCLVVGELSDPLYPTLTVTELNAWARRAQPDNLIYSLIHITLSSPALSAQQH